MVKIVIKLLVYTFNFTMLEQSTAPLTIRY